MAGESGKASAEQGKILTHWGPVTDSMIGPRDLASIGNAHCKLELWEQMSMKFRSKYNTFLSSKHIWNYFLYNGYHFVQISKSKHKNVPIEEQKFASSAAWNIVGYRVGRSKTDRLTNRDMALTMTIPSVPWGLGVELHLVTFAC